MRLGKACQPQSAPLSGVGAMIALSFLQRQGDRQGFPALSRWLRISGPFTNSPSPKEQIKQDWDRKTTEGSRWEL